MMQPAPMPQDEAGRIAVLRTYGLEQAGDDRALDDLVSLAARLTGSSFALINVIGSEQATCHAAHGLPRGEYVRRDTMCAHVVANPQQPLIVPDLTRDERFADNPFVTGSMGLRSYLGIPLLDKSGHALGSLCVLGQSAQAFDATVVDTLQVLARSVMTTFELRRALQLAHSQAMTDTLTGLLNRRASLVAVADAVAARTPVAAIAIDLDYFKSINDAEGHAAGDAVLQTTAERLRAVVRPGDVVGRLGGDEFIVLLIGQADRDVINTVANRISAALHQPIQFDHKQLKLGGTLGVACFPSDAEDGDTMLRLADQILMRSKRQSRGTIGFALPEDASHLAAVANVNRVFTACTTKDGVQGAAVYFQPAISLAAEQDVVSIEILARWHNEALGLLEPGDLFGIVGPEGAAMLGGCVREYALAAVTALRDAGVGAARLAFNLSAAEVIGTEAGAAIIKQVENVGASLRQIDIEFREEVLLDRIGNDALDRLAALRGRGARLILDDFGAASCGLSQLMRLPLDGLKLDRTIIRRIGLDERAEEIVHASVSLAHGLGLTVTAKGVETEHQLARLRALGCDAAQGFLIARPMPLDGLLTWLGQRSAGGVTRLRARADLLAADQPRSVAG